MCECFLATSICSWVPQILWPFKSATWPIEVLLLFRISSFDSMPPPRRDSLAPMRVEGSESSHRSVAFADSEDGCRRLPWYCSCCSNRLALIVIVGVVFAVAVLAPLLLPRDEGGGGSSSAPANVGDFVLPGAITFVALGDWGMRTALQHATADTMGQWARAANASFVVSVGDNFYWTGVANASDAQFEETWRLVYAAPSLQRPWFAVFGASQPQRGAMRGAVRPHPTPTQATTTSSET